MGVDFYPCNSCGDVFADAGYFVCCEYCGTRWCSDECAEADGYVCKEYVDDDGDIVEESSCNFCRGEDFDDSELLTYALSVLKLTRDQFIEVYKDSKE